MTHHILIIDDESFTGVVLTEYFARVNPETICYYANSGKNGIDIANKQDVDIILLDWNMPVMDGIETLIELKKTAKTYDIPVIIMSGIMITPENLSTAFSAGAYDYIRKPLNFVEMEARTRAALNYSALTKQLQQKNSALSAKNIQLKLKQQQLNNVLNSVFEAILMIDEEKKILLFNKRVPILLKESKHKLTHKPILDFFSQSRHVLIEEALASKTDVDVHLELLQADGKQIKVRAYFKKLSDNDDKTTILSLVDLSELIEKEELITKAQNQLIEERLAHTSSELEYRKNEIKMLSVRMTKMSSQLSQHSKDLTQLRPYLSKQGRQIHKELISELSVTWQEQINEELDNYVLMYDAALLKNLEQKYPNLSVSDKKLCVFISMNMSSREIAEINHTTQASVNVARSRLRKKLDLDTKIDLGQYIADIKNTRTNNNLS